MSGVRGAAASEGQSSEELAPKEGTILMPFEGEKRPVRKISDEEFEISVPESWFIADTPAIPLKKRA